MLESDTPRTDAFAWERLQGPAQTQRYRNHTEWVLFARQLERELSQAQARCAELTGLLREVYGEFAKRHIRSTDLQSRIDAALKEPRPTTLTLEGVEAGNMLILTVGPKPP